MVSNINFANDCIRTATSGVGSDRYTNLATTAPQRFYACETLYPTVFYAVKMNVALEVEIPI